MFDNNIFCFVLLFSYVLIEQRTRARLLQWGYSPEDVEVFFEHYDQNKDGVLDLEEFGVMMQEIQVGIQG